MKIFSSAHSLAAIVVFTLASILFLDRLIPEGMFFDGLTYASLARNLSIGKGSLWQPVYFEVFYEHPPLAWNLQALFFLVLGDHYYTEKIFCLIVWLLTLVLITKLWKVSCSHKGHEKLYWIPVLLWTLSPTVIWCYPNNMLESLMGIFDLSAVILLYRYMKSDVSKILAPILASLLLIMAMLTKGFVGLFPVVFPLLFRIIFPLQNSRKVIIAGASALVIICLSIILLFLYSPSNQYFSNYLSTQLFASLSGKRDVVESELGRLYVIKQLLVELLPAFAFVLFSMIFLWVKKFRIRVDRQAWLFFLVGLSASLPLMVSLKLRAFYLVPSLPYLAIGFAWYFARIIEDVNVTFSPFSLKWMKIGTMVFACSSIFYLTSKIGTTGRDASLISDLKTVKKLIPTGSRAGICPETPESWATKAYSQRYLQLVFDKKDEFPVLIIDTENCNNEETRAFIDQGWKPISTDTKRLIFMQKSK